MRSFGAEVADSVGPTCSCDVVITIWRMIQRSEMSPSNPRVFLLVRGRQRSRLRRYKVNFDFLPWQADAVDMLERGKLDLILHADEGWLPSQFSSEICSLSNEFTSAFKELYPSHNSKRQRSLANFLEARLSWSFWSVGGLGRPPLLFRLASVRRRFNASLDSHATFWC